MSENVSFVKSYRELAQAAIGSILNGAPPNGVTPDRLGKYGECYSEMIRAHQSGGTQAARKAFDAYARSDSEIIGLIASNQKPAHGSIPELGQSARLDPSLATDACPWLDEYIEFSRKWSPRAYDSFHEACGLFAMSTAAAGRVKYNYGGDKAASLYIALVARTSKFSKSTTARTAKEVLSAAGLSCLLVPDEMTPQAFVEELSDNKLPAGWDTMPQDRKEWHLGRIAFAGQRGWYYDEFGQKVAGMMKANGHMADYRGLLRVMDNGEAEYRYKTRGHGDETISRPYLALLGSMTPADLQPFAGRNAPLWSDGFWARFAFVAPPTEAVMSRGRFPEEKKTIPLPIVSGLAEWHARLGMPKCQFDEDEMGNQIATFYPPTETVLELGDGVRLAMYAYEDALHDITDSGEWPDLDGNYTRLPEKAQRIAALMASMQGCNQIEMRHWARAQQITEQWRIDLHNLYQQLTSNVEHSKSKTKEDTIIAVLSKKGPQTRRELTQSIRGMSTADLEEIIPPMVEAGLIDEVKDGRTARYVLAG